MSLKLSLPAAALVLISSTLARAEDDASPPVDVNAQCARDYEQGQEQRKAGRLVEARRALQSCARDECPEFIRNDCGAWYSEVQAEVPTLVFTASSAGTDLTNVRISIGERLIASEIDGQAIELDPGEYDFEFEAPGMHPLTRRFLIARGERNRMLRVEFVPLVTAPLTSSEQPRLAPAPTRLMVPVLVGVGALGIAGFAGLGAWGRSSESQLNDTCAPGCTDAQVSDVRTKYLLADVSLGVGVAGVAAAAYFFFSERATPKPAQSARLDVRADANGWSAYYGGTF